MAELQAALAANAESVTTPFVSPKEHQTIKLGDYEAVVAYGCLEVSKGTFFARARTPFAMSDNACEGTRT